MSLSEDGSLLPKGPEDREKLIRVLTISLYLSIIVAGSLIVSGLAFVLMGATGDTEVTLFGNTMKSQSAGVICVLCGTLYGHLSVSRILKALERLYHALQ